ncbi:uncharacterized protein, partial [Palaemon carinicauda]|uniref:uncharacterized protein n=1 Tax=Palaemon carinicauda TaxID=392227 RepID=UPI0035B6025C
LALVNDTFKTQETLGIIERIDNIEDFMETHPEHSFMPFMGVFKPERDTTKCRVVFLSNLYEKSSKSPTAVSHNMAIFPGPSLNQKLASALLQLRFDEEADLKWAYSVLPDIFIPYRFNLQQFATNCSSLQENIDDYFDKVTSDPIKLLGLQWHRSTDKISTKAIVLDISANTKRLILKSIASHFDVYNFNAPLLNRAKLFLHDLQVQRNLGWDDTLTDSQVREWRCIARQANSAPPVMLDRNVGNREDLYDLVGFADSSKVMFGCVIYLLNFNTNVVSFVMSKSKIVNKQLESKSIPSLELQALSLGTECLIDLYQDIAGDRCIEAIKINKLRMYSDSLVTVSWVNSYVHKLDKMQKRSVFVLNRLEHIANLCEAHQVEFSFVSGVQNPADCVTRPVSHNQLTKTNFITGPDFLTDALDNTISRDILTVLVPDPDYSERVEKFAGYVEIQGTDHSQLIPPEKVSSFGKLVNINVLVLKFVNCLKTSLVRKHPDKYSHLFLYSDDFNYYREAYHRVILLDQRSQFPEIFEYFNSASKKLSDIPPLVSQLNVYQDNKGLLRVKIKKYIRACIGCKRFRERPIKLNQSSYREVRIDPPNVPFRNIYIDHMGPFYVKVNNSKEKVWILVISCMWSRAVNLKLCDSLSVEDLLRALQLHIYQFGMPEYIVSDLGTQMTAGSNIIETFLSDFETKDFLRRHNMNEIKFDHYYKGNSELGGLVEICVKLSKRLIQGAVGKNILPYKDFEFIVSKTVHLINRRPIAFKDSLREYSLEELPEVITPEKLLYGRDLVTLNIIPQLQSTTSDPDWSVDPVDLIRNSYEKLVRVQSKLIDIYNNEFLNHLVYQATSKKDRYKPVPHKQLKVGDLVLVKENMTKAIDYPIGIVKELTKNIYDEVTGAKLML